MKRQARSLHALIINLLTDNPTCATVPSSILAPSVTSPTPSLSFSSLSILDASCGIGTQTIGLASLGCRMSGSDVCEAAVNRCRKEGQKKGLNIELIVSDMRDVRPGMFKNARRKTEVVEEIEGEAKEIGFDVVMSLGDSLPHLLTRRDMVLALTSLFDCLRPGGLALFSFTDRAAAPKGDEKGGHSTNMRACGIRPSSKTTGDGQPGNRYIVWQVWDWVRPQRKSRPMTASSTSSGNVGGWHFMKSDSVVGLLGGGHSHHIDGDVPADGSLSKRDEYDDTETDGSKNAGGGDDDDMDEDLADDWLPQDDDPMGLRPPEVRDEVWLAPNGLSPLAERGSLRMRSRQPSITSPLSASQGALATISGLARPNDGDRAYDRVHSYG
ncbi:S-adenosyl-L-methionine-dependent methyltransferase [Chytridium lagenaria]|nr:S-adenosyl-L-methionine-dependent methyltransferase [Chytridium lagenaria]